jgi:hypothetical protein
MQIMCVQGHEGLLEDGNIYNVIGVTQNGNFLLEGVEVPEGYTSFAKERFQPISDMSLEDTWDEEMEERYWAEQVPDELNA